MKKIRNIILLAAALVSLGGCNLFLEMPEVTGSVYLDDVFSTRKDTEGMLWRAYHRGLREGLPEGWAINHGTLASLSGEITRGYSWHAGYNLVVNGPSTVLDASGQFQGAPANFNENWEVIRACWIIIANIDKCEEIPAAMKEYMKGEAYALIAYRYVGMFQRWGGVPIVRQANEMTDNLAFPRASAESTLAFALEMIQEAEDRLPDSWFDIEPGCGDKWEGRITRGAVLAMKARLLTFAARPLFNAEKSYAQESGLAYSADTLIWLGGYKRERYQEAIDAHLAVLNWAENHGKHLIFTAGEGNRNSFEQAIDDYGRGVSELNGPEILLAFKIESDQQVYNNMTEGYNWSAYVEPGERSLRGVLTNFVRLYRDTEGGEIDWPVVGESAPRDIADFAANIDKIEPRFRVDICVPGKYGRSNDGDAKWNEGIYYMGSFTESEEVAASMSRATEGRSIGVPTKFYYKAGARRWFEFPLFRLAENYLSLAECYNELGDAANAQRYLNIIRNRAGLPAVEETDQARLRALIVREKALEFFEENQRYYDVKHWKHPEIGTKILGGPMTEISFLRTGGENTMAALVSYWDAYSYTAYWHPKWFLEPFRQDEVNKGIIVQNPGY
ncbi:MAG: RagB/SusD family nutrient uptake outer membrane protein [Bacteroidales bacterium]|nr:RagB/SusD family nutrient uptake outer membrane protein [Bacteroidales bacterium]